MFFPKFLSGRFIPIILSSFTSIPSQSRCSAVKEVLPLVTLHCYAHCLKIVWQFPGD